MRHASVMAVLTAALLQGAFAVAGTQAITSGDAPLKYAIGVGDALQIFVWKEAELTRDVTVRLDGKITVPLLGEIQAVGRTPEQLAEEIAAGLKKYLAAPQVTLAVKEATNSRVFVIGRVNKPGVYPLTGRLTFLQALALAGGLQDYAKTERIVIVRQEGGSEQFLVVSYKKIEAGSDVTGQNVVLMPGDTIVVP